MIKEKNMFKKTPAPKNTVAKISALAALVVGLFVFVSARTDAIALPWLAQIIAIILLTFSLHVTTSYLLKRYTFIIESMSGAAKSGEGAYDFIITQNTSNREIKVCHVSDKCIKYIRPVTPENKKTVSAERKKMQRYTYDITFAAPRKIEIVVENGGEEASMLVTYDEELLNALISIGVIKR